MCNEPKIRKELHFGNRVISCFADRPANVLAKITASIESYSANTAVVDATENVTYAELDRRALALTAQLGDLGLAPGQRVAIIAPNCIAFVVALLAIWRLGAVPVPINPREAAPETAFILNDCQATGLVFAPDCTSAVPAPGAVPALSWRLLTTDFATTGVAGPATGRSAVAGEDDTACLLYTSGTTGKPKGAMLTHLGIIHSVLQYEHHFALGPADAGLLVVPATHVTGLIGLIMTALGAAAKLIMMREFDTTRVLEIAERERMTYTIMVPAMYNLLLLRENLSKFGLAAWRIGAYGGSIMPVETIQSLAGLLPRLTLVNAYGATETTSPTSLTPLDADADASVFDTVGRPVHCAEVLVMNDTGQECAPGEIGEFWVRGPMVVASYWNRPEVNQSDFVGGFWRTGDIGEKTADGYLRVHDRRKDLVNRGGYKVFSSEVENVLLTHDHVIEAAVVPRPCPVLGERVHAFVHVDRLPAGPDELIALCAAHLADYKIPETFTIMHEPLPRNANGKILKRILRDRLLQEA